MGEDKDLKIVAKHGIPFDCPARPYHVSIEVDPGTVQVLPDQEGTPYELSISIVLLDRCNNSPSTGLVGFVDLGAVLFYSQRSVSA